MHREGSTRLRRKRSLWHRKRFSVCSMETPPRKVIVVPDRLVNIVA